MSKERVDSCYDYSKERGDRCPHCSVDPRLAHHRAGEQDEGEAASSGSNENDGSQAEGGLIAAESPSPAASLRDVVAGYRDTYDELGEGTVAGDFDIVLKHIDNLEQAVVDELVQPAASEETPDRIENVVLEPSHGLEMRIRYANGQISYHPLNEAVSAGVQYLRAALREAQEEIESLKRNQKTLVEADSHAAAGLIKRDGMINRTMRQRDEAQVRAEAAEQRAEDERETRLRAIKARSEALQSYDRIIEALYAVAPWDKDHAPDPVNIIQDMGKVIAAHTKEDE